jgi:hypothetical protein
MLRGLTVILLLSCSCFISKPAWSQHVFTADTTITLIDGHSSSYNMVQPGDTVILNSGLRKLLRIQNFTGEKDKPVIFMNRNGQVIFDTDHYYGMSILNCQYIRLTGTGDANNFYGIKINRVSGGAGIGIGGLSSDYEIDHVSIENCLSIGIFAKTDPDCSLLSTRGNFTQYNTLIHDNYIGHVGTEGFYIGSTLYFGQTVNCNGVDTLLLPHLLDGVKVYKNIIEYSGWDGIQVSSASKDCQISDNIVLFDSQEEFYGQMSGIIIGGGSHCDCYNNYISQGKGQGIQVFGLAGEKVYNNIIVDAGKNFFPTDSTRMVYGIFVSDITAEPDSSFTIVYNTIIHPKSDGIRFSSSVTKNNLIASNLIVNPGNYDYYENGHTSFHGEDAYIMFPGGSANTVVKQNFLTRVLSDAMLSDTGFMPLPESPLVDSAYSENRGINFDFYNHIRPYGNSADIGAVEFNPASLGMPTHSTMNPQALKLYPNPVRSMLCVRFPTQGQAASTLDIYDLKGNRIYEIHQAYVPGAEQEIRLQVEGLSPGIYLYKLNTHGRSFSGRFIKLM